MIDQINNKGPNGAGLQGTANESMPSVRRSLKYGVVHLNLCDGAGATSAITPKTLTAAFNSVSVERKSRNAKKGVSVRTTFTRAVLALPISILSTFVGKFPKAVAIHPTYASVGVTAFPDNYENPTTPTGQGVVGRLHDRCISQRNTSIRMVRHALTVFLHSTRRAACGVNCIVIKNPSTYILANTPGVRFSRASGY